MHLRFYNLPLLQRQIVRIILIVPIYALGSLLSLLFPAGSLYFNTVRDVYEAYVIHSFLALMLDFPGGEPAVVRGIADQPKLKHPIPFCCLPRMRLDHEFIQWCKRGTLQFVFLKPLTAFISLILMAFGRHVYESKAWQYTLLVTYNISYTLALYVLLLFYMATKKLLKGFSPVGKFGAVKIIVFATYYQSLLVVAIPGMDELGSSEKWNDFIICVEVRSRGALTSVLRLRDAHAHAHVIPHVPLSMPAGTIHYQLPISYCLVCIYSCADGVLCSHAQLRLLAQGIHARRCWPGSRSAPRQR